MKLTLAAGIMAFSGMILLAQTPPEQVTLDAVATNRSGPVKDLTAKDFKVWEDNKEQTVTSVTLRPPGKHAVVLLFDNTTVSVAQQSDLRTWVAKFIDAVAGPNLYMEVATFRTGIEVIQPFTTSPAQLKTSLTGTAASSVTTAPAGAINANAGARSTRQTSLGNAQASGADTMQSQAMMESLRGLVESLAPIKGRKVLLMFTGGQQFSQDATTQVNNALDAANKANVAIYGISDNTAFAKTFADATGGNVLKFSQSLPEALQQVIQEQDATYAVTYTPTPASAAGTCHQLRLKVDAAGADTRYRKSYCTGKQADALADTPVGRRLDARLSAPEAGSLGASIQAPWFQTGGKQARVSIVLDAASNGVKFQKEKGRFHGELNVAGAAYDASGRVAAHFSETVTFEFADQKQADAFSKAPYHYENQLTLLPGKYTIKAVISPAAEIWGKAETAVTVVSADPAKLSMSGIALSRELRNAAGSAAGLAPDMIDGQTPLIASGRQIVPTGIARFQKTERALFYAEIYDPSLSGTPSADVSLQIRIAERSSGTVKSDSGAASIAGYVKPGNPVIAVASTLATAQLPPGAYRLELIAAHAGGTDTVLRSVDFDLN